MKTTPSRFGTGRGSNGEQRRQESQTTGDRDTGVRRRAILLCALALPFLIGFYALVVGYWSRPQSNGNELRIDQFLGLVERGQIGSATILAADDRITGSYGGGAQYWVDFSGGHETLFARLTGALETANVPTTVKAQPLRGLVTPVSTLLPVLILGDLFVILFLAARGGTALGGFGRAAARQVGEGSPTLTFADLAGADEAVEELTEIRDYLADPTRFAAMGAAAPRGVLLSGPPGCGKTRLAKALAGESAVPFFSISGSDFVEMYVGVGAARIRDLFVQAKAAAPSIVFIDEIDAVGRARAASGAGGSEEREATLNQLLVEMDGFGAETGVVVMAATNRPDMLDSALLRPGRFDRRITIDPPDRVGREAILAVHAKGKPLAPDADLASVAARTAGFSGADLANVLNEAALLATRRHAGEITSADLSEATERVVGGPSRRSRVLSDNDRHRIAVHESGHAVVSAATSGVSGAARVAKVSVLSRGHAGGFTLSVSEDDRVLATRSELTAQVVSLLGGRAAEVLCFGEPSTGSNDDLARAAELARRMVWECGMSERLGPLAISAASLAAGTTPPWSETTASEIDAEARRMLAAAAAAAAAILDHNRPVLETMAAALVASESLEGDALDAFLRRVEAPAGTGTGTGKPPVRTEPPLALVS